MRRIALIAALPGELRYLVGGWESESREGVRLWRFAAGGDLEIIAACAGMGAAAAARAFAAARRDGPLGLVVSAGWAGSLRPELKAGRVCRLAGVIDARTGERFPTDGGGPDGWAVTAAAAAGREEKWRLAAAFGATVVEMEAAEIARQARAAGVPFRCLKAVSDGWNEDLPDFGKFMDADGGLRWGGFAAEVLARPWRWPRLMRLGRNSGRAARNLTRELPDFMMKRLEERTDGPAGA
ncbi:MAG TPA: hypothetical protein VHV47_15610 [Opitutaceae bacterium]|jgi:adenosylhomocysteine nucleosidase|nr:hypothetical protein [Opitutaceae bacterium]